jgi:tRNA (cytidine/uridine-2'-O-)-methyltransferase
MAARVHSETEGASGFVVVLYQPEIPPNTGNIGRLCVATKTPLHLIRPLGFSLEDRFLKRAGLDYWQYVELTVWDSFEDYLAAYPNVRRIFTSARNGRLLYTINFQKGDHLIFGPETRGFPKEILDQNLENLATIPIWGPVRSLNVANAVSIVLFEALRQTRFKNGA